MTGYGFCGPMTEMFTVFEDKSVNTFTGQNPKASRLRFAYQLTDVVRVFLMVVGV